jgi:hypothetical protein
VVIGAQTEEAARDVLISIAERLRCPISVYGQDYFAQEENGRLAYQDEEELIDLPLPRLVGRHQQSNAAAAIRALKAAGFELGDTAIAKGLVTQVSWPGRLERLPQGRLAEATMEGVELWIDGGHNPGAGKVIAEAMANLEERDSRPLFLITGMINTKDPVGYFEAFVGMARHVFAVPVPASDASIDPELLADAADEAGLTAESAESVEAAIDAVTKNWNRLEPAAAHPHWRLALSAGRCAQAQRNATEMNHMKTPRQPETKNPTCQPQAVPFSDSRLQWDQATAPLIQLESAVLGDAPTLMSATAPALNMASVGIERTPNCEAISGFSSMLILATFTLPSISLEISSRLGAIILHGPHHSAQKSTTTGTLESSTSLWKLALSTFTVAIMGTPLGSVSDANNVMIRPPVFKCFSGLIQHQPQWPVIAAPVPSSPHQARFQGSAPERAGNIDQRRLDFPVRIQAAPSSAR